MNKQEFLSFFRKNGLQLKFAKPELKNNADMVMAAISNNIDSFQYASNELKSNSKFIMSIARFIKSTYKFNSGLQKEGGKILYWVAPELRQDKGFVQSYISEFPLALEWIPELASDKMIVGNAVSIYGIALKYASPELKEDMDIIRIAYKQSPKAILYVSPRLKANKGFMIDVVTQKWECLQYADLFTNDIDVVRAAISTNANAILYASNELQNNKGIIMQAVNQDGLCILHLKRFFGNKKVYDEILYDKDVIMAAVNQNGNALEFVPPQFKIDKEVVLSAIKKTPSAIEYIESSPLWEDPLFIEKINKLIPSTKGKVMDSKPWIELRKENLLFHGPVIILITTHGQLLPPFTAMIPVERHLATDFGTCNFTIPAERIRLNSIIRDTLDIKEIIDNLHKSILNRQEMRVPPEVQSLYDKYWSSHFYKIPKSFHKGDRLFNKEFTYKGEPMRQIIARGVDSTGNPLAHILSNYQQSWTLKNIMLFVKSIGAIEVILFDFSCSMYDNDEDDFKKYGGKTRKIKTKKTKKMFS